MRVPEPALGSEKISLDQKPKTQTELTEQRKQIGLNFNLQTFKTFKVGIHGGRDLPNFYAAKDKEDKDDGDNPQTTIEWYKQKQNAPEGKKSSQTTKSATNSHRQLQINKKFWAKPDEYTANDKKVKQPEVDKFKQNRVIKLQS